MDEYSLSEEITIEEPEIIEDEMYENLLGTITVNVTSNHSQYLPNQHTVSAITGLTETLTNIQALKNALYTKESNIANYYLWNDENPLQEDRKGYFVSINEDHKIILCTDESDIFGVTVDTAGFVGGQEDIAKDYRYALVVQTGLIDVRCESNIVVGNYVRPNNFGKAKKDTIYGYKVVSISEVGEEHYATIMLGTTFEGVCDSKDRVTSLEGRMDNAEINIAAAINVANTAQNTAEYTKDAIRVAGEASNKATEAFNKVNDIQDNVYNAISQAEQALNIANSSSTVAANIRNEAVATANQALAQVASNVETVNSIQVTVNEHTNTLSSLANWKTDTETTIAQLQQIAGPDGTGIQGLVANIDKYRVGDYSQANGLTFEQAQSILDAGSVYIPTTEHTEVYGNTPNNITMTFSRERYYIWTQRFDLDNQYCWVESPSVQAYISRAYVVGNSSVPYWYVNSSEDITYGDITYTAHALYYWDNGAWKKVTTLNSLGRSVGLLQAKADEILAEVTNARGTSASLDLRISNNEAQASMIASMVTDNTDINVAYIVESDDDLPETAATNTYYAVGTAVPYDVYKYNGNTWVKISYLSYDGANVKEINAASIINAVNDDGSEISMSADRIKLTGGTIDMATNQFAITAGNGFRLDQNGISWSTESNPTKIVYAQSLIIKPANGTLYSSFATSSTSTWHTVATSSDKYASETTNGGTSWSAVRKIVGDDSYHVEIRSSSGNIFRRSNISTVLTCHVFRGSEEITNTNGIIFNWVKKDDSGLEDEQWSADHQNWGNQLTITSSDVWMRATYDCYVTNIPTD